MAVIDFTPFNTLLQRLEGVADRLERGAGGVPNVAAAAAAGGGGPSGEDPAAALAMDVFIKEKVQAIEAAARATGIKEVGEATATIATSYQMLRDVIAATGRVKKPADSEWASIFAPFVEVSGKAQKACDNRNPYFQTFKAAAEAINLVTLVTQSGTKGHVTGVLETVDFHLVKVMQKKNPPETAWAKAVKDALKGLEEFCTENCKMGFNWKPDGQDPAAYFAQQPMGGAAAAGGVAPAAPAPAKPAAKVPNVGGGPAPAGGMASLFGAIKGKDAGGLKKVADEQKTKNRSEEEKAASSVVPAAKAKAAAGGRPSYQSSAQKKGPKGDPIKELQRETNWMIENQADVNNLKLEEATMQQCVIVINCRNVTLNISTKVKSISIDGCEKVNVICTDVLSVVELVNSDRCQVQTIGKVNSFAIDKCNGVNLFLPKESIAAEIVTSKSCEMNVTIPDEAGEEGDTIELPIPEQFVTKVVGTKKLKTEVSSLYS